MKVRKDPELMKKIKEAEDKRRTDAMVEAFTEAPADALSFDQWWMMIQNEKPLRPHLKEILWADFKAQGLGKHANKDAYDKALKVFGY